MADTDSTDAMIADIISNMGCDESDKTENGIKLGIKSAEKTRTKQIDLATDSNSKGDTVSRKIISNSESIDSLIKDLDLKRVYNKSEETESVTGNPINATDTLRPKRIDQLTFARGDTVQRQDVFVGRRAQSSLDLRRPVFGRDQLEKVIVEAQKECKWTDRTSERHDLFDGHLMTLDSGSDEVKSIYESDKPNVITTPAETSKQTDTNVGAFAQLKDSVAMRKAQVGFGLKRSKTDFALLKGDRSRNFSKEKYASSVKGSYCYPSAKYYSDPDDVDSSDESEENVSEHLIKKAGTEAKPGTLCRMYFGNISVNLKVGNLTEEVYGIIVGTCTRKLQLSKGALSKAISEMAGPALQAECFNKYPHGIQRGEVAVLSPCGMSCAGIYFGALPGYFKSPKDTNRTPVELLKALVTGFLQQAFNDRQSTISFPAFGTGYLEFPPAITAQSMLEAIYDFSTNNRGVKMTLNIVLHNVIPSLKKNKKPFMKIFQLYSTSPGFNSLIGISSQPKRFTREFCVYMYSITSHHPPEYWTRYTNMRPLKDWQIDAKNQQCYKLVDLNAGQDEFQTVEKLMLSTWERKVVGNGKDGKGLDQLDFNDIKVTKVQRVENPPLYEKYVSRRAELFRKAGGNMFPRLGDIKGIHQGGLLTEIILDSMMSSWLGRLYGEVNEGYLFHGTKANRIENLLKEGIDVRMAHGGTVYGPAVYMAESSTKSDQYTDNRDERRVTNLQMFLCRACLGEIKHMKETRQFRRPPCKEGCEGDGCSHDRYDLIAEEGRFIFREFIVYDTHQVYPEYIITYDRVKTRFYDKFT